MTESEQKMSSEELEQKFKRAYSFESRAGHGKELLEYKPIGTVQRGPRFYDLFEDSEKNIWYKTRIKVGEEILEERKAVFGSPSSRVTERLRREKKCS